MNKSTYVDGFVIVIPKKNTAKYKKMAREGLAAWKKFGALDYKECIADDMKMNTGGGSGFSFPKMVKLKPGETIWFSFITYKSRKHRDAVNKKVMAYFDKKYKNTPMDMPFDMKRFTTGGFKVEIGM
ncbi:MAG: DUF1428 domain-containing protein [Candidatus Kerfeldbacteria bacterium]|nr:DUF1428 domain-containing protein [Candidatus Kerfeldbacteria bacterium]